MSKQIKPAASLLLWPLTSGTDRLHQKYSGKTMPQRPPAETPQAEDDIVRKVGKTKHIPGRRLAHMLDTKSTDYKKRLVELQTPLWKTWLHVQVPYRWNIRRIAHGTTLEIGCGIGRNLMHLDGKATGIDHNHDSVIEARRRGLNALTPEEFQKKNRTEPAQFDNVLFAHVIEHMSSKDAENLIMHYQEFLKKNGKIIVITPQEKGYLSDPTHITFLDFKKLASIADTSGFKVEQEYSFPFPRPIGHWFPYNEFVSIWRRKSAK